MNGGGGLQAGRQCGGYRENCYSGKTHMILPCSAKALATGSSLSGVIISSIM